MFWRKMQPLPCHCLLQIAKSLGLCDVIGGWAGSVIGGLLRLFSCLPDDVFPFPCILYSSDTT